MSAPASGTFAPYASYHGIPTMNPASVLAYLEQLGRSYSGQGIAVELGSWLGGSTAALLNGLVQANYKLPFLAYDRWYADDDTVTKAHNQGVSIPPGSDIRPLFLANVLPIYSGVIAYKGQIEQSLFLGAYSNKYPIEICLFDAPKTNPLFEIALKALSPHWIPGTTVLGLMDYHFHLKKRDLAYRAPVEFMERNAGCFEKLMEWSDAEAVFFRYHKPLKGIG